MERPPVLLSVWLLTFLSLTGILDEKRIVAFRWTADLFTRSTRAPFAASAWASIPTMKKRMTANEGKHTRPKTNDKRFFFSLTLSHFSLHSSSLTTPTNENHRKKKTKQKINDVLVQRKNNNTHRQNGDMLPPPPSKCLLKMIHLAPSFCLLFCVSVLCVPCLCTMAMMNLSFAQEKKLTMKRNSTEVIR